MARATFDLVRLDILYYGNVVTVGGMLLLDLFRVTIESELCCIVGAFIFRGDLYLVVIFLII